MAASIRRLATYFRQKCRSILNDVFLRVQGSRVKSLTTQSDEPIDTSTLRSLYQFFYLREPDQMAMLFCKKMSVANVLDQIFSSSEFKHNLPFILSRARANRFDPRLVRNYSLFQESTARYNQHLRDLIKQHTFGGDYRDYHFERFVEQHSLITHLSQRQPIRRILDISFMPFTSGLYKRYLDEVEVCTIDLPVTMGGPNSELLDAFGVDKHWEVDLNSANLDNLAAQVIEGGCFDLVIATEVIEHLQVDFSAICKFMAVCAGSDGLCFVTTPNYLSSENMRQLAAGKSPQQRFLNFNANRGGHYHFREYTMHELEEIIAESGFHVLWNIYSSCWEDPRDSEMIRRARGSYAGAIDVMRNMAIIFSSRNRVIFDAGEALA